MAKNNEHVDKSNEYGALIRAIYLPADNTKLDFNINYEYLTQGAYPYQYMGSTKGVEPFPQYIGKVAYNRDGKYKRHLLNTGLNVEHQANRFIFNSVTGFQFVKDDMKMDQDYTPMDIFILNQKQNSKTLSQEFVFKSNPGSRWEWTTGLSGFYQWLKTDAPVYFDPEMNRFLSKTIEDYAYYGMLNSMAKRMGYEAAAALIERAGGCHITMNTSQPSTTWVSKVFL